ncbi:MAG: hypothetical protein RJA22_2388 [Verrucomicrobiota bacterium]|jgi:DNA-binding NtrC family response regulator
MSSPLPPVLVVDDEKNMRASLQTLLGDEGYAVRAVETAEEGLEVALRERLLAVITDAHLPGLSGYDLLARLRQARPELPVILITAYAQTKQAVQALRQGATDYLLKPFDPDELLHAVARCAERHQLVSENLRLRRAAPPVIDLGHIIGESPRMEELRSLIQTVAASPATVLILGETGVGKELVAGAIHHLSNRREGPYVRINCAAIPEALLESELFGHEKGAFTGALRQKLGRVEEADGGTVFLDEIGDMSRPLQAKLLRFLEDGSFTRVGGNEERRVDVRLIAATNRDIIEAIRQQQFREDLYHRLNVFQLRPPPLRERGQDVILLADHFLRQFAGGMRKPIRGFTAAARQKLLAHHWPGNVRELRNVIERAVILESTPEIQAQNLPDFQLESRLRKGDTPVVAGGRSLDEVVAQFEKDFILNILEQNRYNLARTAEQLQISRHALRYRMQRLNIQTGPDSADDAPEEAAP